jgi:hypothetical protein
LDVGGILATLGLEETLHAGGGNPAGHVRIRPRCLGRRDRIRRVVRESLHWMWDVVEQVEAQ